MHKSTMLRMGWYVENYIKEGTKVLDVGSYSVNGSYRELFEGKNIEYVGLDIEAGPNVDIVMDEPYSWSSIEDESFDYIISGQAFEHIEFPWLTIREISKKLKPGGGVCIIAPNSAKEHRYPFDCYRYFGDGLCALAKWAGLEVLDVSVAGIPDRSVSPEWDAEDNDACLIARKSLPGVEMETFPKFKFERRVDKMIDKKLECDFLAKWIMQEDAQQMILDFIKAEERKKVYIYGYENVGKILYKFLKEDAGIHVEILEEASKEIEKDALMLITLMDHHRDLKLYLDTKYEEVSKYYVDEILELVKYRNFFEKYQQVYLYGPGVIGRRNLEFLHRLGLNPTAFIVSDGKKTVDDIETLKVYELKEFAYSDNVGIIISVSDNLQAEVEQILQEKGYENYILGHGSSEY